MTIETVRHCHGDKHITICSHIRERSERNERKYNPTATAAGEKSQNKVAKPAGFLQLAFGLCVRQGLIYMDFARFAL
jgi:hypothetical protein